MRRVLLIFLALLLPVSAGAQNVMLRPGEIPLTYEQLVDMTSGNTLTFYDDGRSKFSAGGAYSYTYAGGGSAYGVFKIRKNGRVCISFRNGRSRCDIYVRRNGMLLLITERGERFPIRVGFTLKP